MSAGRWSVEKRKDLARDEEWTAQRRMAAKATREVYRRARAEGLPRHIARDAARYAQLMCMASEVTKLIKSMEAMTERPQAVVFTDRIYHA